MHLSFLTPVYSNILHIKLKNIKSFTVFVLDQIYNKKEHGCTLNNCTYFVTSATKLKMLEIKTYMHLLFEI